MKFINVWKISIGYRPSGNKPSIISLVSDKEPTFETIKEWWDTYHYGVPLEDHRKKGFHENRHHIQRIDLVCYPIVDQTKSHKYKKPKIKTATSASSNYF